MDTCPGFVYVLRSLKNFHYYVGSTINLEKRLIKHNNGYVKSTKNIRPLELVFSQKYETIQKARQVEYKLKQMKSREIIQRVINDGIIKLQV